MEKIKDLVQGAGEGSWLIARKAWSPALEGVKSQSPQSPAAVSCFHVFVHAIPTGWISQVWRVEVGMKNFPGLFPISTPDVQWDLRLK